MSSYFSSSAFSSASTFSTSAGGAERKAAERRARFALVQVHTLPDFLVFAALPFFALGKFLLGL